MRMNLSGCFKKLARIDNNVLRRTFRSSQSLTSVLILYISSL